MTDVENLLWELPNLLNTRFTRFDAELSALRVAISDNTKRVESLERTMTLIQTDMRDLRGGVTRQLVEQDKRLAVIETKIDRLEAKIEEVLQRLPKE